MQTLIKISTEEYLTLEKNATFKSEYHAGEIINMAGASQNHNLIVGNIITEMNICLKKKKCNVYPSDFLVHLPLVDKFVYPDVSVVCGEVILGDKKQGIDVLCNPTIVIEVLSDSTELYDRTEKFSAYQTLPSLQQYILVNSKKKQIEIFNRTKENNWLLVTENNPTKKIKIGECEILLEDIYLKTNI